MDRSGKIDGRTATLEEMMEVAASIEMRQYDGDEVTAKFMAQTEEGNIGVFFTPFGNEAQKVATLKFLKLAFAIQGVKRYVMVAEQWQSAARDSREPINPPSQDPNRTERIGFLGVEHGRVVDWHCSIEETGGERRLGDLQRNPPYDKVVGRMTELLPAKDWKAPPEKLRGALMQILSDAFAKATGGLLLNREEMDKVAEIFEATPESGTVH